MLEDLIDPEVAAAIDGQPNKVNEVGYDAWGMSPEKAKIYFSLARKIYQYFRPEIHGIENIPAGRALVVPNHSGQLPYDGLVIGVASLLHAKPPRLLRAMAERWFPTLPFVRSTAATCCSTSRPSWSSPRAHAAAASPGRIATSSAASAGASCASPCRPTRPSCPPPSSALKSRS
jgi:hypothetical protein